MDCEGDTDFIRNDLLSFLGEIQKIAPITAAAASATGIISGEKPSSTFQTLTTKSIASKLGCKSGSDLAEAAVAHLAIMNGKETFKRAEINEAMKSASGLYKNNMTSNLSAIIKTLLNQKKIVETSTETYALTPEAELDLKGRLGIG